MVSQIIKRTPTKSLKELRRRPKRSSPDKKLHSPAKQFSNIYLCKKRIAKLFSKILRIRATPKTESRYKGYKALKRIQDEDLFSYNERILDSSLYPRNDLRRELFAKEKLPPFPPEKKGTIFLDLDETLIHSKVEFPPEKFDFVVQPNVDGELVKFYVLKRPGIDELLDSISKKFEVVLFTAAIKEYASLVVDVIDRNGVISHRLYRDSCTKLDGKVVKDLSVTGRDLRRVMIVDDNPNSYYLQPGNAVPIKPFLGDPNDGELLKLTSFLDGFVGFDNLWDAVKDGSVFKDP